ncbi:MAG TPA: glycosyl hydrolase family 28-related protein [Dyadobacter sp.]|nr:glycosyl hydrolase family 28-related protein [Dyadobacter sp.]
MALDNNKEIPLIQLPTGSPTSEDWVMFTSADGHTKIATFDQFQDGLVSEITDLVDQAEAAAAAAGDKMPSMTLAELKALNIAPAYTGVYLSDELKAGTFVLDNATDLTPDDSVCVADASGNKWVRRWTGWLNVKWFGAVGNGIANDTAAIAAAQALLVSNGGGTLFFPSGTYLTNKFTMSSRIFLDGEGKGISVLKLRDNQNTDLVWLPKNSFINRISRLTLDANKDNNLIAGSALALEANTNADGAKVDAIFDKTLTGNSTYRYLEVKDVCVTRGRDYGMYIPAANYIVHIDGLYAYKNRRGFYTESTDNIFTNIVAERNDVYGIQEHGGNNKWSDLKVIWNGIARTEEGFMGYFGGMVVSNANRATFINIEAQDNFGPGIHFVDSKSLKADNLIADSNCYLDATLVTDGVSSGIQLDNVEDSVINGQATNYKNTQDRPWPQTRAFAEDHRCKNNVINITSKFQETNPITTSENMRNTHDIVSKRATQYVGTSKTFEIDEPVIESGVLINTDDRITIPCVIPFRNEVSFILDFEYLSKTAQDPILIDSDVFKLQYLTSTGVPRLKATITTEQGTYSSQDLNFTLTAGFYRIYCGMRRLSTGGARIDFSISYTVGSAIQYTSVETEQTGVPHIYGVFNNIHFNNYNNAGGSTVGNIRMRLFKFGMFPVVLPEDFAKFSYRMANLEKAAVYIDFTKPFGSPTNVIRATSGLPAPSIYYLNKYFITDDGFFVCIKLADDSYKFVSLMETNKRQSMSAKSADYTATVNDSGLTFDATAAARTCTLPPLSSAYVNGEGLKLTIKKTDSSANTVLVDGNGSETIDGSTGFSLTTQNHAVTIQAGPTEWKILDVYVPNPVRVSTLSASGNGSSVSIDIAHGLSYTPIVVNVLAMSSAAADISYVTVNSTTLSIKYATAPASGTNNLQYSFSYRRP